MPYKFNVRVSIGVVYFIGCNAVNVVHKVLQANSVQDYKIGRWFLNSCFSAIGGTVLYLFVASLAAYAFTFINFKYRNVSR